MALRQPKAKQAEHRTNEYLEILGDTVYPRNLIAAIALSIICSLGGYRLGLTIFPSIAKEEMVASYSLLLGIGGSLLSLFICSRLFKPSRILTEEETSEENMLEIFHDLQLDPEEEYQFIKNDPVTKKEMEALGILDKFSGIGGGVKK